MKALRFQTLFFLLIAALWSAKVKAQLACGYQFSYTQGQPYTAIPITSGVTTLAAGSAFPTDPFAISPTDEDIWPSQNIGFNFVYNGSIYNTCGIATNGWIWFGNVAPIKAGGIVIPFTNILSSDAQMQGIVSALNADLQGRWSSETATIKTYRSGNSPNRRFTIEWKNFKANDPGEGTGFCGVNRNRFDFQITLCETTNQIEFAYNVEPYCYQGYNQLFQVGLRGSSKADVHARLVIPSESGWQESSLGFLNSTAVIRSSAPITRPAANARFIFTPGIAPDLTWIGTNSNWWNPANWSPAQVPMRCNTVRIPSGRNYYPELTGNKEAQCGNLIIESGAALTFKSNYQSFLSIYGDLTNNGTLVNNTNNYISLAGGNLHNLNGNGSYLNVDLFITRNSNYVLENDIALRRLYVREGSGLDLNSKTLDVFSLIQEGEVKQGNGLLIIEGGPDVVSLTDSTFKAQNGTTLFGSGEIWNAISNQTVPSVNYNNLWIRTNKDKTVTIGTQSDVNCHSLLFYNPGEAGGIAQTSRNINIQSNLKLGIDNSPGTFFKIHHQLRKNGQSGFFDMGSADEIDITSTNLNATESAIQGYPQAVYRGRVKYESNQSQVIAPGTYHHLTLMGSGTKSLNQQVKIAGILKVNDGTLQTNDSLSLTSTESSTGLISGEGIGTISGNVKAERYVGADERWILAGTISDSILISNWRNLILNGADGVNWNEALNQLPTVWSYNDDTNSSDYRSGFTSYTSSDSYLRSTRGYVVKTNGQSVISMTGQLVRGQKNIAIDSGINLLSNPYPSPIDWNTLISQQSNSISKALFTYSKQLASNAQTAVYLPLPNGEALSVNGGSPHIAMLEGFMIKSSANDTLRFNHSQRTEQVIELPQQTQTSRQAFKIKLVSNNKSDETLVFFDPSTNNQTLNQYDIEKLAPIVKTGYISTIKNNTKLAIQSRLLLNQADTIPLSIYASATDYYQIKLGDVFNIEPTAMIYLHDKMMNTIRNIRINGAYQAFLNEGMHDTRFEIIIKSGVMVSAVGESCTGNDGLIHFTNSSGIQWNFSIFNSADSLIDQRTNFTGHKIYQPLKGGEYRIVFSSSEGNYEVEQFVNVALSNKIRAQLVASSHTIETGEELTLTSLNDDATGFLWNFGDGMLLAGSSVTTHSFEHEGLFTVTLRVSKQECYDTAQVQINVHTIGTVGVENILTDVSQLNLYPNPANDKVNFNFKGNQKADLVEIELVDLSGKTIKSVKQKNVMPDELISIELSEIPSANYYIVTKSGSFKSVGKVTVIK